MRRIFSFLLAVVIPMSFTACSTIQEDNSSKSSSVSGDSSATENISEESSGAAGSSVVDEEGAAQETSGKFNFETRTVTLNSGYEMPIMGLGPYSLSDEECYNSVTALLEAGGRLIDTAYMYHNEAAVGRAIRDSDVPREEIFVITKIYPTQFDNPKAAIDEAMVTGWHNGDISFDGTYFSILFGHEEESASYGLYSNLGRVSCPLSQLEALHGSYDIRIEKAE